MHRYYEEVSAIMALSILGIAMIVVFSACSSTAPSTSRPRPIQDDITTQMLRYQNPDYIIGFGIGMSSPDMSIAYQSSVDEAILDLAKRYRSEADRFGLRRE